MNKVKFFKIIEMVDREGETSYKVLGAESKIDVFLNNWTYYSYKNKTIEEAIDHVYALFRSGVKSEKTVYQTDIKSLSNTTLSRSH